MVPKRHAGRRLGAAFQSDHADVGKARGRRRDADIAGLKLRRINTPDTPRHPLCIFGNMARKALPAKPPPGSPCTRRQRHRMIGHRVVDGGTTDLDHFESGRSLQHAMANSRRLQHRIARLHRERRALIFIHHTHPSRLAENHLKTHAVKVNVIGHRPAGGNADK